MKTNAIFSKTILALAVLLFASSFTYGQAFSGNNDKRVPAPLRIAIATYDCIDGGSMAIVYHPIQGFVFDTRRYQVTWADDSGKLVSGQPGTNSCICGISLTVTVRDLHTGEAKSMRHQFIRCNSVKDDNPVFLDSNVSFQ